MANKIQVDLHQEKIISQKIMLNLLNNNNSPIYTNHDLLTINDVSLETGVPATTIRYWDKVGLISIERCTDTNYRIFTVKHIRQILTIYALKFSVYTKGNKYCIDQINEELREFDYSDRNRIITTENDFNQYLNKVNRVQIKCIVAIHHLCIQVETNQFDNHI